MSNETEKPRKKTAAAIKYDSKKWKAPRLVAKGVGLMAERIIEIARERAIPIHFDPDLSALLAKLELESDIPTELYQAVAEVLAVIYRANRAKAERDGSTPLLFRS